MSGWRRFWIGGGGALLPLLVTLLAVDISGVIDHRGDYSLGEYVGAALRYVILFGLGGIVAALNSDEHSPIKLVQLGIAAPALVASYVNAQPVNGAHPPPPPPVPAHAPGPAGFLFLISPANAAEANGVSNQRIVLAASFLGDVLKGFSRPLSSIRKPTDDVRAPPVITLQDADALHRAIEQAAKSAAQAQQAASKAEAATKKAAEEPSQEAIDAAKESSAAAASAAADSKAKLDALKATSERLK